MSELNLYIRIDGVGKPPIVIEPAIGSLSFEWYYIQKELSKVTTVITYDRPGYGNSPKSVTPRTSSIISNQLFNLVTKLNVEPPFVLLGHLEGGLYVQDFAMRYQSCVAGIILIDSLFPNYFALESNDFPAYNELSSYNVRMENLQKIVDLDQETFARRIIPILNEIYADFPDEYRNSVVSYQSEMKFFETIINEMRVLKENVEQIQITGSFPEIPLFVVSHDPRTMESLSIQNGIPEDEARRIEEFWLENQKNLSKLSPRGKFFIAENSDRNIHYSNPLYLIEIAKRMIKELRINLELT